MPAAAYFLARVNMLKLRAWKPASVTNWNL
jgi:hypothetical protein